MVRIVVLSDTHGAFDVLLDVVRRYEKEAAAFIHCGDGKEELALLKEVKPDLPLYAVRGNCDFGSDLPAANLLEIAGHRLFFTHGHRYSVGAGDEMLLAAAKERQADIVLFGHLHIARTDYLDGIYLMNPGSPVKPRQSKPSFGILDLSDAGVAVNLVTYRRSH